jgi:hypothetical protein
MNLFCSHRKCNSAPAFRFSAQIQNLAAAPGLIARFCEGQVDFAGTRDESFSLREIRHDVSLRAFAAPKILEISAI